MLGPSFSEALAYIVSDANDPIGGQEIVEFDFGYKSSYRFSGGYRFCGLWRGDCVQLCSLPWRIGFPSAGYVNRCRQKRHFRLTKSTRLPTTAS